MLIGPTVLKTRIALGSRCCTSTRVPHVPGACSSHARPNRAPGGATRRPWRLQPPPETKRKNRRTRRCTRAQLTATNRRRRFPGRQPRGQLLLRECGGACLPWGRGAVLPRTATSSMRSHCKVLLASTLRVLASRSCGPCIEVLFPPNECTHSISGTFLSCCRHPDASTCPRINCFEDSPPSFRSRALLAGWIWQIGLASKTT